MAIGRHGQRVFTSDEQSGVKSAFVTRGRRRLNPAELWSARRYFRVLVADDSDLDRQLTIRCLGKAWPFERDLLVEWAADGVEALERLRSGRFALVVLDWNMPRLEGETVLRTMREEGLCIPVVVVSGQRREDIRMDLGSMGAAFVNKDAMDPVTFRNAITASIDLQSMSSRIAFRAQRQCQIATPSLC